MLGSLNTYSFDSFSCVHWMIDFLIFWDVFKICYISIIIKFVYKRGETIHILFYFKI